MLYRILLLMLIFLSTLTSGWAAENVLGNHLVRVADIDPTIVQDLRYATADNFTGKIVYPSSICLLRPETAARLAAANRDFARQGYRLKLWDAYRPLSVQKIFWELVPDENYVANPAKGSRHNRGGAVDVTLVDAAGRELEMPSLFDDFSARASRGSMEMTAVARRNMNYLTQVMEKNGFRGILSEWWHFEDREGDNFPVMDISLESFDLPEILWQLEPQKQQALVIREREAGSQLVWADTWERTATGWQPVLGRMDAVIGKAGFAPWGAKKEGDSKTPRGIFLLGQAFGYSGAAVTALPYRQTTANDYWVDDPASPNYNRWVSGPQPAGSFERMKPDHHLYEYGVVVEYNTQPVVAGQGSAIFVHVWRKPGWGTEGCVALSREDVLRLLAWLDPAKHPVIVLGI